MKKVIPAIAMTLLGASLLGTSTYAWFSANTSATADGLSIKAQASSSLLVSASEAGTYGAKATMVKDNTPAAIMEPVIEGSVESTAIKSKAVNFKKINDTTKGHVGSDGKIETGFTPVYVDTDVDYVQSQIWLAYSGADATPSVNVSAKLSSATTALDDIYKAVHVTLVAHEAETLSSPVADFTFSALDTDTAVQNFGIVSKVNKGLDVYVWVDGNDENCKNANAINGDTYNVSLKFELKTTA